MHECLYHSNMAHKWTFWIALWGFLCAGGLECTIQSEGTSNNSTVCANGQHTLTCVSNVSVIAITEMAYGYKEASLGCMNANGSCCTYNRTTDCLEVATNEAMLMESLSGKSDGVATIADALANTTCTSGYTPVSTFNIISYQCIQESRIKEMCVPSSYRSEDGLPVYVQNRDYRSGTSILAADTSCSVSVEVLSRSNNTQLYILHMQLSNTSNCQQSITVSDGNKVVKTFNCDPAPFNQIESETLSGNYFLVNLTNTKTETGGKFWIGVEGASGNPPIVLFSPAVHRINCGDLSNPVNGNVSTTDSNYGSVANYTCNSGYDVTSGNNSRTCQENSTWSGTDVVCTYNCGNLTAPQNGFVSFTGTYPGHTASYGCHDKYVTGGGNLHRSCIDRSGWNGTALKCVYECGPLNDPHNGSVLYNATTAGSKAWYICNSGFKLNGTQTRNCITESGWNGLEPTCSAEPTTQPFNAVTDDKERRIAIAVGAVFAGLAVVFIVAIIIRWCLKNKVGPPRPEKQDFEVPKDQSQGNREQTTMGNAQDQPLDKRRGWTENDESELADHSTKKKKKKKKKEKFPRQSEQNTEGKPQDQSQRNTEIDRMGDPQVYDEEYKRPNDRSMDPMEPPHIELKQGQMNKGEELPQYSMFPGEPSHVEGRLERPHSSPGSNELSTMHPSTSNSTETDTHLLHRPLSDHHCHDFAFHPHGELSHWTKQKQAELGLETTNQKKKKKKKRHRVPESAETTIIPMEPEYKHPHDNSLSPKESPIIRQRLEDSYVKQQELETFTIHLTTSKENETNAHLQHELHKDHIHTYTDHTRAPDTTSEFSDHHCHDFAYHPHEALSHWTREEESKLGLPHETTETKKKKKKKKKKRAKHQEQDLFD